MDKVGVILEVQDPSFRDKTLVHEDLFKLSPLCSQVHPPILGCGLKDLTIMSVIEQI